MKTALAALTFMLTFAFAVVAFAQAPEVPIKSVMQLGSSIPGWNAVETRPIMCGSRQAMAFAYAVDRDVTKELIWLVLLSMETQDVTVAYFPKGSEVPTLVWFGTYEDKGPLKLGAPETFDEEKHASPCSRWGIAS